MQLPPSTKKPRTDSHQGDHNASGKYANKEGNEAETNNYNDQEQNDEYIKDDTTIEVDEDLLYNQNEEEMFYYDEDDNDNFDD